MTSPYTSRPQLELTDLRLKLALTRDGGELASLNEYAAACGIDAGVILTSLEPYLLDGTLLVEFVGGEMFLHTAPMGRPTPSGVIEVAENLWERLRVAATPDQAYTLWKLTRALENSGWKVETRSGRVAFGLGRLATPPRIGLTVRARIVPLLGFPDLNELASPGGMIDQYEFAGATALAVTCDKGQLDRTITEIRRHLLTRRMPTQLNLIVCEAPRFNPTLLTAGDRAVAAHSVSIDHVNHQIR